MEVYAVAVEKRQCHGHGDFSDELSIEQIYNRDRNGRWPPVFTSRELAEEYRKSYSGFSDLHIVKLNVI